MRRDQRDRFLDAILTWHWLAGKKTQGDSCELYHSDAIPDSGNYWIGTNLAGLADADFDAQCVAIGNAELAQNIGEGVDLITEFLPAVPLIPQISLWVAANRVDLARRTSFADIQLWRPALP
jgi:hypothetical protein